MTAQQEKEKALAEFLANPKSYKYVYNPIFIDQWQPRNTKGGVIRAGARVAITRKKVDTMGLFRWIADQHGNHMSIHKNSIEKI